MSDEDHAPSFYPVQHNRSGGSAFRLACDGALSLLDHLVGEREQRRRETEAQRFSSLEI
jgi:hypothetical protein